MKRILILLFIALMAVASCNTYTVRNEVEHGRSINKMKSAGILVRLPENSRAFREEYERGLAQWIAGSQTIKRLEVVTDAPEKITYLKSDPDRFFQYRDRSRGFLQFGEGDRFMKYKSLGIINNYLGENRGEFKRILNEKNFDGLMVYEVFGVTSTEMQFVDFDSMLLILDKDLKVVYLDRQTDSFPTDEFDSVKVRRKLINCVSERLIETLDDLNFIDN